MLHIVYYTDLCFSTPSLLQLYPTVTRANQSHQELLLHRAPSPHSRSPCLLQALFLVPWFQNSALT